MKLQILKQGEQPVENYNAVFIDSNGDIDPVSFNEVSDNECTEILAGDILNYCTAQEIPACVDLVMKKLRLNGSLTVGGTDIRLFCKSVINNIIDKQSACDMISNFKSMSTLDDAMQALAKHDVEIINTTMSSVHYTVKVRRSS